MKAIVSAIFGFALIINAALFVPQAWHLWKAKRADGVSIPSFLGFCAIQFVGTLDGHYQHDNALLVGMAMSLLTCGLATGFAIYYSVLNRAPQGCRAS
ncbi:MAG: PQ-loop repeat-containing protein [Steroidobacteraceae bacterium]